MTTGLKVEEDDVQVSVELVDEKDGNRSVVEYSRPVH